MATSPTTSAPPWAWRSTRTWCSCPREAALVDWARAQSLPLVVFESEHARVDLWRAPLPEACLMVFGSETRGVAAGDPGRRRQRGGRSPCTASTTPSRSRWPPGSPWPSGRAATTDHRTLKAVARGRAPAVVKHAGVIPYFQQPKLSLGPHHHPRLRGPGGHRHAGRHPLRPAAGRSRRAESVDRRSPGDLDAGRRVHHGPPGRSAHLQPGETLANAHHHPVLLGGAELVRRLPGGGRGRGMFFRERHAGRRTALALRGQHRLRFPFGWIFGRLGCFLAYDHPGAPTTFFLGQKYRTGRSATTWASTRPSTPSSSRPSSTCSAASGAGRLASTWGSWRSSTPRCASSSTSSAASTSATSGSPRGSGGRWR